MSKVTKAQVDWQALRDRLAQYQVAPRLNMEWVLMDTMFAVLDFIISEHVISQEEAAAIASAVPVRRSKPSFPWELGENGLPFRD